MGDRIQQAGHMAASDPIKTVRRILQARGRPHMGTGRSLSSGRPKAGPVGRCDRIFDAALVGCRLVNLVNGSEH
jgi:hypothetical protein